MWIGHHSRGQDAAGVGIGSGESGVHIRIMLADHAYAVLRVNGIYRALFRHRGGQ